MQQDGEYWLVSTVGALVSWLVGWIEVATISEAAQTALVWAIIGLLVKKADNRWKDWNKKRKETKNQKSEKK